MPPRRKSSNQSSQAEVGDYRHAEKRKNIPPPEMGKQKKTPPLSTVKPREPKTSGNDLFIVDNSDENWKVADYLREWGSICKYT